jgi:hypothetical protein
MPATGSWLPAWTNPVAERRATTWVIRQMRTNRDFAEALGTILVGLVIAFFTTPVNQAGASTVPRLWARMVGTGAGHR